MDPILAKRLKQQQEKEATGENAAPNVGSASNIATKLDPKLAARFAKQQEKLNTGESAVESVSSQANNHSKADSELSAKWTRRQEIGNIGTIGSQANKERALDPVLAKRFSQQQEKEATGKSAVEHIASAANEKRGLSIADARLAERLQQQAAKTETPPSTPQKDKISKTPSTCAETDDQSPSVRLIGNDDGSEEMNRKVQQAPKRGLFSLCCRRRKLD